MCKALRVLGLLLIILMVGSAVIATPPPPANYQISTPHPQLQNEERICVSPVDSTVVMALWRDFRLGYRRLGLGISHDGGNTWADRLLVDKTWTFQSDPEMQIDRFGNFYLCFMDYDLNVGVSGLTIIKSTNNGRTWSFPIFTFNNYMGELEDKQFMAIDNTGGPYDGNIYMAWARFDVTQSYNQIMLLKTTTALTAFTDTIVIGPPLNFPSCGYYNLAAGQFAFPIVDNTGAAYVFWTSVDEEDCALGNVIKMVKSTDGGETFSEPTRVTWVDGSGTLGSYVDGAIDVFSSPMCAADITDGPFDGNLYISYTDRDMTNIEFLDYNIEFIKSSDGGATWSEPIYINDDPTGPGAIHDQFHPWLYCNQEGTLFCIFYDQRLDPNHYNFDAYIAYSFDGGETFTTNHRVSNQSSNPSLARSSFRAGKIAEYIGITAFKDHVNAVWTDTRNGNQDVFGANWVIPFLEPRLIAPANNEVVKTFDDTFTWASAWKTNDDRYRFELASDPDFVNTFYQTTVDTNIVSTGFPFGGNGLFYWRVKAFKISTLDSSEYSPVYTLLIDTHVPDQPSLLVPPDKGTVNDALPTFVWSSEANVASEITYTVEVSTEESFAIPELIKTYQAVADTTLTATDPVLEDISYFWHVKAANRWGETNGFGTANEFTYVAFICGDVNRDLTINLIDILYLIDYKYGSPPGSAPNPMESGDVNADGNVNLIDILYMIDYKYGTPPGPEPNCP